MAAGSGVINLVPRVSHLAPSSLALWGGKKRDPGNEIGNVISLPVRDINLDIMIKTFSQCNDFRPLSEDSAKII